MADCTHKGGWHTIDCPLGRGPELTVPMSRAAAEPMPPDQEAAAFHGIALNYSIPLVDRWRAALKALEYYADEERLSLVPVQGRHVPHCNPGCVQAMHNMADGPHEHADGLIGDCEVCD